MIKPVYLFLGLLDSGKTSAIKLSLTNKNFNRENEKNLIIILEDGDISYDEEFLIKTNSILLDFSEKTIRQEDFLNIAKEYEFDRMIIEANGMSDPKELIREIPKDFTLVETLCFFDCELFEVYLKSYRQIIYNLAIHANMIILNRYSNEDKLYFRNNLKAINPTVKLVFEDVNGNIVRINKNDIFDFSKEVLKINDNDFGLWYLDALEEPYKYENRRIELKLTLIKDLPQYPAALIMGRMAMVCCMDDLAPLSLTLVGVDKKEIKEGEYYLFNGVIHLLKNELGDPTCVLYVDECKKSDKPENELVNFL